METTNVQRQMTGIGNVNDREENDFYSSDPSIIDDLFSKVKLEGTIWENACGDGVLSKRMKEYGYKVYSSDLIDRGYGEINDYLKNPTFYRAQNIVTNPPFKYSKSWVKIGLKHTPGKICILHKIQFLESKERFNELFNIGNLEKVLVYSKRIVTHKGGVKATGGVMAFAWFIFDRKYFGKPEIDWFDPNSSHDSGQTIMDDGSIGENGVEKIKELLSKGYKTSSIREIMRIEYGEEYSAQQIYSIKTLKCHRKIREELNERIVSYLPKLSSEQEELVHNVKTSISEGFDPDYICESYQLSKYMYYKIHGLQGHCYTISRNLNDKIRNKVKIPVSKVHLVKKLHSESTERTTYKSIAEQVELSPSDVSHILKLRKHRNIGKRYNDRIIIQLVVRSTKSSVKKKRENIHTSEKQKNFKSTHRSRETDLVVAA
ncbi:MAG: hypothetical protein ABFS32_08205 [Bacteroidota bacterium]